MKKCKWYKKFDGHFSISCANKTGKRANGEFKLDPINQPERITKWNFIYCPYCSEKIEIIKME